ncbi:MAG: DNA internalization-related competence protein ComEC/Rec2 [Desulfobacterales bacterium]|nr:DNA internalization-related competence protein ComEC/Rec2 [Desulfobacterales bacterium]
MVDKNYFRPVIPLLIGMMSGITCGAWLPGGIVWGYGAVFPSAAFTLALIQKNIQKDPFFYKFLPQGLPRRFIINIFSNSTYCERLCAILPIILFFALGYISIQHWVSPKFVPEHVSHFSGEERWNIIGSIASQPVTFNHRTKFILKTEQLSQKHKKFSVTGKINLTVLGKGPQLSINDRIAFISKIKKIQNFKNPGGFNYTQYMQFNGIYGLAYVQGEKITVITKSTQTGVCEKIGKSRIKVAELVEKTITDESTQGVMKALIIGDRTGILPELRETFNRAGCGHLLAISGLHIGSIATAAFIFFQWILSYSNSILWHAWSRKGAALLSLFPVILYGLFAGMSPSTQRAVIMVAVFMLTLLMEREHEPINTLAIAAMMILIIDPPALFSVSFQLSFASAFSILYGLYKIKARKQVIPNNQRESDGWFNAVLKWFVPFFTISFLAILGALPLVMFYFNQVSLVGILINFIVVPITGFFVIPLGLFAVFIYPLSIWIAEFCLGCSAIILYVVILIIKFFANLPFAAVKTVTPSYLEICCYYILAGSIFSLIFKAENSKRKKAAVVFIIVIIVMSADTCYWLYKRLWHNDLKVTVIDVGQGTSTLVELPYGVCMLIDGGGFTDNSVFDVGEKIVAPFLWRKKIKTVDALILSHPDSDHLNGLLYICEHFNVKYVRTNNEPYDTNNYKRFIEIIRNKKIHMPQFKDMDRIENVNGVEIKILYPCKDFISASKKEKWRRGNNNSLVIKINFGSKSFLFPGDIEAKAERELVKIADEKLKSNVLVAPHHGSKKSSTLLFLKKVQPEYIIISAGNNNRFGFPHSTVLTRYRKLGCRMLQTATHGAIEIVTDGQSLKVEPFFTDSELTAPTDTS